jgi:ribokinase
MGPDGALVLEGGVFTQVPAPSVRPVDTTAAGDVFNGALAVALSERKSLTDAVRFACEAAAVSVTRLGAQSSIPYRNEL